MARGAGLIVLSLRVAIAVSIAPACGIAQAPAKDALPVVELKPQEINLWEHKVGPDQAIHLDAAEYEEARKSRSFLGREYVQFEIVVSENGRVDAAKLLGDAMGHEDDARAIEMARVFKPWVKDGVAVRVRVTDYVGLLPPEKWAAVKMPFPEPVDMRSVSMGLKRTICYGSCPDYEVTVAGDGTVRFTGNRFVAITGEHVAHIPADSVKELVEDFKNADFFSAKDKYTGNWTDNPTQTLSLTVNGRAKTVVDYVGTDAGLPLAIRNLEQQIDDAAGTARWVKGDERTLASLEEEKWPFGAATKENVGLYDTAITSGNRALLEKFLAAGGPIVSPDAGVASPVCVASGIGADGLVDRMMEPAAVSGGVGKKLHVPTAVAQQCLRGAASSGNVGLLQFWLDEGASPTAPPVKSDADWTSEWGILPHAVVSGNPEMVRRLLRYDLDVKERIQDEPLLIFALRRSRGKPDQKAEIVEMLARAGADVNARDFMGQTPIFAAEHTPEAIKPLLAAGANLEARDNNGNTALVRYGFMEPMVRELLADGADPTASAKNGDTPLKVAKQYQCPACVTLIEEALKKRATAASAGTP
jgi:hypothetical protein